MVDNLELRNIWHLNADNFKSFVFLIIVGLTSCKNKEDGVFSMNDPRIPIHILIDSIENHGSIGSFYSLETASLDHRPGAFLSTFLIMADKYNSAAACKTVYYQVVSMYDLPMVDNSEHGIYQLDSLNDNAKEMAIKYLIKADSLGDSEAKDHVLEYRKNGLIK